MYAVIDTETTGLNLANDRIIELAVIGLDAKGNKEWEWCSLINPERDTGGGLAIRVHQIYPRDVADAPTFSEFSGHIIDILNGRALIAHNARFDLGMLGAEFGRLGVSVPPITQICTADLARDCGFRPWKLEDCCAVLGIEQEGAHHALADARATWSLAHELFDFSHNRIRSDVLERLRRRESWPILPVIKRDPITRPIFPSRKRSDAASSAGNIGKSAEKIDADSAIPVIETFPIDRDAPESKYLAAVERVLEDRVISAEEKQSLENLQSELQLTDEQTHEVHMNFIRGLAGSMWDDGEISRHEQFDLKVTGKALQLSEENIKTAIKNPVSLGLVNEDYRLQSGEKVVFTGEMSISRSEWTSRAKKAGLRVTGSVSGKTDYLVVPFGETGSSKSLKARELGVRVISEQRFVRMIKELESSEV